VLGGAASAGAWLAFRDIDTFGHEQLCFLFDALRNFAAGG
jgi:hypothetical protein